jgi:DNA polymerase I-like protein with 3'-5' exonuclease and polymerase domains
MIAMDSETSGLDLRHSAKPFLVTTCDEGGLNTFWEWDVNPLTRQPIVPSKDLREIRNVIRKAPQIIFQNPKFDVAALDTVWQKPFVWPWKKTVDTLLAGHLLASGESHILTTMVAVYLGLDVQPFEDGIKEATTEARRMAKKEFPTWFLAKKGAPGMPSVKEKAWKCDMWLPRAIAKEKGYSSKHPWWSLCADYANSDSATTLALYKAQKKLLEERGLWTIYLERLKLLPIVYSMESTGITLNGKRLEEIYANFEKTSTKANKICSNIARSKGCELTLPKGSVNKSLMNFVFYDEDGLQLPVVKKTKKGAPSFGKESIEEYLATLPTKSKGYTFIKNLRAARRRSTAMSYLESYKSYWLSTDPIVDDTECRWCGGSCRTEHCTRCGGDQDRFWYRMHPSLNPTGTATLRWSSQGPNEQQISKQEDTNLRYVFGPLPGREWWSLDANNIELRLPAYEAGESEMIALFEKPNDAPFFGSNHLLVFSVLHPKMFAEYGADVKKKFASTWYQWTKNGNFAVQYGAMEQSGTADRAYHVKGAQHRIQKRFQKIAQLNQSVIAFAEKHGYVETMPDKTVDPTKGYPLQCRRTYSGHVMPTVPLNYRIQGTAMWWMGKAMVRCKKQLGAWNKVAGHEKYKMIMQVHDEIVFDFPKGGKKNLAKINKLRRLMERGGDDIGIPTPVSIDYHPNTWNESLEL